MRLFSMFSAVEATAHCDLPCGVYDPAQARIEAESVKAIQEKYQGSDDEVFKMRAVLIKEARADLVKHHLWVLWTDYFKPPHFEKYPPPAARAAWTPPRARSCWTTSPRSTRSSGRPRPPPDEGPVRRVPGRPLGGPAVSCLPPLTRDGPSTPSQESPSP
jgi:hypothetical protein